MGQKVGGLSDCCYLDTHVAIQIGSKGSSKLSHRAKRIIESRQVLLSPAAELELAYLDEIGSIRLTPEDVLARLRVSIGLRICNLAFADVVYHSRRLSWTRDVFDRLIVGHAIANEQAFLITFDRLIQEHYRKALA